MSTSAPRKAASEYRSYADLAAACKEGEDFLVKVQRARRCSVAIIAPHAGRIEPGTSQIAMRIAGENLNLYLLEGKMDGAYAALHLTSHLFDDPRCLELLGTCKHSISVHGCSGDEEQVLVGGLDEVLKIRLVHAIGAAGIHAFVDNHRFAARDPNNVVNCNNRGMGAQLEFTRAARRSRHVDAVADAVRRVALTL